MNAVNSFQSEKTQTDQQTPSVDSGAATEFKMGKASGALPVVNVLSQD